MTDNRRNYYRVLHVQPEAPLEIIKASYRTLMSTLRQHPDLGGDTAAAMVFNEAYAVLKNPLRRAHYDAGLLRCPQVGSEARKTPPGRPRESYDPGCPICRAILPATIHAGSRCGCCDAPLAPPPASDLAAREFFGRRGSARCERHEVATMAVGWPAAWVPVRWHDLSRSGLSVLAGHPLAPWQRVRITDPALDVVAEVVSCVPSGKVFVIRARLVTVLFTRTMGVFVSQMA